MSNPSITRLRQLVGKTETTEGTYITIAAADALDVIASNILCIPNIETYQRDPQRASLSPKPGVKGKQIGQISFDIEMYGKGAGSAGTPPAWGKYLKACNFVETSSGAAAIGDPVAAATNNSQSTLSVASGGTYALSTDTTYMITCTKEGASATAEVTIVDITGDDQLAVNVVTVTDGVAIDLSDETDSPTITFTDSGTMSMVEGDYWFVTCTESAQVAYVLGTPSDVTSMTIGGYADGLLHVITGARGDVEFKLTAGQPGIMSFSFTGAYVSISDASLLTLTDNSPVPPAFMDASFTVDSYSGIIAELSFKVGNVVTMRTDANKAGGVKSAKITSRRPTAHIDPEMVTVATKDYPAMLESSSTYAIAATLGGTSGNMFNISLPECQVTTLNDENREGIDVKGIDFDLVSATGNTEISITQV